MIRCLAKDTDIQRLIIKIKRLEKTNEIRDNVLQSHQGQQALSDEFSEAKKVDQSIVLPPISGNGHQQA